MKKFEYCFCEVYYKLSESMDNINRLGQDGWEMSGCGSISDGSAHRIYFKREII